jgi:tetratricopeptide (TPR) repeat protein
MSGIGNNQMTITAKPEAQAWFTQGLNLIDDFWDYESARAFEQGVRVDPQCAMCYWGLYQAESFYHSTSQGYASAALDKAIGLRRHVSKRERLYIDAAAAYEKLVNTDRFQEARKEEVRLLRKLVQKYPKENEAQLLLAASIQDGFDDSGQPRAGQKEALALLGAILEREPNDSAANHYYIHATEVGAHPERARHSADILPSLAPSSGHMVHMPGHIYYRIGDYASAEQAFRAALQVDEQYMRDQHVKPDDDWNYVHNLMYFVADLLEEGKFREATAFSAKLAGARGQLDSTLYSFSARDSISRLDPNLPVLLRTGDWVGVPCVLKTVHSIGPPNLDFLALELRNFAAGMNAARRGDTSQAEESSAHLDAGLWRMSNDVKSISAHRSSVPSAVPPKIQVMPDAMLHPLLSFLSVMSLELRASILIAKKQSDAAKKLFAQAENEEKALGYREPPSYIRPVAENEAEALASVGDWSGAKAAYQRALLERPRSGFALYGIALCTEKLGDLRIARDEYSDFLTAWKYADNDLPQLQHADAFVAQHPISKEN